ncbi:T9SS type A sorting domain-containing protein [Chryseobacterium sp.]|uniref:T9SS type A sorting domain-containing protein n=1 Tax=Chryseobacterium sp. TaxID=1871047 RepID=UPI00321ADECE
MKTNLLAGNWLVKARLLPLILLLINSYTFAQLDKTYVSSQNNQIQGLCLLCSVQNPQNVIGDNENNYTAMMVPIGLLANIEQTLVFPETASHFRKITIGIGTANTPVKQLPLGKIFIETFMGNTPNGDYKLVDNSMIKAEPISKRGVIEFSPTKRFDRIKLSFHSGLLNLGDELRIYYAHHLPIPFTACGNPPLDPMAYYPFDGDLKDKIKGNDIIPEDQYSASYTNGLACAQALTSSDIDKFYTIEPISAKVFSTSFWALMETHMYIGTLGDLMGDIKLDPSDPPNQLNHYTIQYSPSSTENYLQICIYVNGKKQNCSNLLNTDVKNPLLISLPKASIDELIMYDRLLDEDEIKQLAESYNIPFPTDSFNITNKKSNPEDEIFTIFPNPTAGQITLNGNILFLDSDISIRNTSGAEVYRAKFTSKTFDLPSSLPDGIYILSIQTKEKKMYTRKIILRK